MVNIILQFLTDRNFPEFHHNTLRPPLNHIYCRSFLCRGKYEKVVETSKFIFKFQIYFYLKGERNRKTEDELREKHVEEFESWG